MKCKKCGGRAFLDRIFTENKNFEASCIICGNRRFIDKDSELGKWLQKKEQQRMLLGALAH